MMRMKRITKFVESRSKQFKEEDAKLSYSKWIMNLFSVYVRNVNDPLYSGDEYII